MELLSKLEQTLAVQYKKAPHLPLNSRKWLVANVWWITLVGVILSALGLFGIFSILAVAGVGLAVSGAVMGGTFGATAGAALGGVIIISVILSVALYVIEIVLFGMAVSPLKLQKRRGWDLLYYVAALNAVVSVISGLLSFNIVSIILGLVFAGIGAYFLFEIREYFGAKVVVKGKTVTTKKAKA